MFLDFEVRHDYSKTRIYYRSQQLYSKAHHIVSAVKNVACSVLSKKCIIVYFLKAKVKEFCLSQQVKGGQCFGNNFHILLELVL